MKIKYIKSKGQVFPVHVMKAYRGVEVQIHSFLTSAPDVGVVIFMIWPSCPGGIGSRLLTKIIKYLSSNTSCFNACKVTCFGPYMTIIRPICESS